MTTWITRKRMFLGSGAIFFLAVGLLLGPLVTGLVSAQSADGERVHACVSKRTGKVRLKALDERCSSRENSVFWNTTGPQGLAGEPGAQGSQGLQGPPGLQGVAGRQGPAGQRGPEGPAGTSAPGGGGGWDLGGNAGTSPRTNFLGTTDDQPLDVRVNDNRALRIADAPLAPNIVGGHGDNEVPSAVSGAVIGGGGPVNRVSDDYGVVGGGLDNRAGSSDLTVDNASYATVTGGRNNASLGESASVGGGRNNIAGDVFSTVSGGRDNTASNDSATVSGGRDNQANNGFSTVSGGRDNAASGLRSVVGGGRNNSALGDSSVVSGGNFNTASEFSSTVAGGRDNVAAGEAATVAGGRDNLATNDSATVSGGRENLASGWRSTIPGGHANATAGDYSFAAGRQAKALHPGAFVWGDSLDSDIESETENEFVARATGGVRFITGAEGNGAVLSAGSGAWSAQSDRNAKSRFSSVDGKELLKGIDRLPITTWGYKGQQPDVRHIGPTAQDFQAAFGLGEDSRYISSVDADGVSLAGVQALYRMAQAQAERIDALEARLGSTEGGRNGGFGFGTASLFLGSILLTGLVVGQGTRVWRRKG